MTGIIALVLVAIAYVTADAAGRVVLAPVARARPHRRQAAVGRYARAMVAVTMWILRTVGRARFDIQPRFPSRGGVLVLMNHQSLIDVPVGFTMVPDGYPRFVTHHRYARGVPLVSHMIRQLGAIAVYPGRTGREELDRLADVARSAEHPIVLFPEGHRTRDGEIRPWKRGALDAFLSARAWTVYVVVIDGLWRSARLGDFVRTLTQVRCRVETAGVFEYDGRDRETHDEFVERMRGVMCDKLAEMRDLPGARSGARAG